MKHIFKHSSLLPKSFLANALGLLFLIAMHTVYAGIPASSPIFLQQPVTPLMMLNMSRDHQLYFKLYDDYSDLDGGGADTTYKSTISYFGYFDSNRCYTHDGAKFSPTLIASKTCNAGGVVNEWSGNFLNWATMTRMDAIRKILYGGFRSTDSTTQTILERAYLPPDTHAFAKFYNGTTAEINKLVPTAVYSTSDTGGITICNVSDTTTASANPTGYSQADTSAPLMKVAKGNYALWANNERWQCKWSGQKNASNSNNSAVSGLAANGSNPGKPSSNGEFIVRIESCVATKVGDDEDCKLYPNGYSKPTGVLQKWGETDRIKFGLITGSYAKSKSGGVLRKNISSIKNEIHANTGQIITATTATTTEPMPTNTIITTINKLRLFGYDLGNGLYSLGSSTGQWYGPPNESSSSDNCNWFGGANGHAHVPVRRAKFDNGRCSNWGNPQAEIYLESLRYLAGQTAAAGDFSADDSGRFPAVTNGLPALLTASWVDPITSETGNGNYCAPLNVLQFNASVNSYDSNELGTASDIGLADAAALETITNAIANAEGITGKDYFVGENGVVTASNQFQICSAKTVNNFAAVRGICSEAPRLEGSYLLSGLAYHARSVGVKSTRQKVKTYGVSLAPAVPSVTVSTGDGTKTITIMPACRNKSTYSYAAPTSVAPDLESNCAIVDFKIVSQTDTTTTASGKLYVSWEDSEQGGDFDQDMWGIIEYSINKSAKTVTVSTQVAAQSTGDKMGFGYIIDGTTSDGFKVHSGIEDYIQSGTICDAAGKCDCGAPSNSGACTTAIKTSDTYSLGDSSALKLKDPLYYAAKWGGYKKSTLTAAEIKDLAASTYFYATDPRQLKQSLDSAIGDAAASAGSAATVAANSTQLKDNTYIYQARFNSADWSGQVLARKLEADGTIGADTASLWNTDNTLLRTSTRKIYTYDGATAATRSVVQLTSANWTSNLPTLKTELTTDNATNALKRFNWILGAQTDEIGQTNGILRERTKMLGDVINSDPAYAGGASMRYDNLPKTTTAEIAAYGASEYAAYVGPTFNVSTGDELPSKANRTAALFVGSNDGMLHAFNVTTGAELFAYMPRGVYAKLAAVSSPGYAHEFLVDGPVFVGDAYITVGGVKKWRTLVTGTLGAGGKGAFALDVTDTLATGAAPTVIFDVTNDKDNKADCKLGAIGNCNDLGYSPGRVLVAPIDGKWRAVFGNGSNSASGTAKLISIDIDAPTTGVDVVDTKAACNTTYPCATVLDNGLAEPALLPNSSGVITTAYVGDIMGNIWKFDLSTTSSIPFGNSSTPKPLITLIDADGVRQPVTSPPTLGYNSVRKAGTGANQKDSVMVYVGTGKYYETGDIASIYPQSMYGIADTLNDIALTKTNRETKLHKKEIATTSTSTDRTITGDKTPVGTEVPTVDWDDKDGWFLDLVQGTNKKGERVISKPLLLFDRLVFPTFIPSSNQCDYGGSSWLMELTGVGDKFAGHDILGNKGNHILDTAMVSSLINIISGDKIVFIGTGLDRGQDNNKDDIFTKEGDAVAGTRGRMSWRQIK